MRVQLTETKTLRGSLGVRPKLMVMECTLRITGETVAQNALLKKAVGPLMGDSASFHSNLEG